MRLSDLNYFTRGTGERWPNVAWVPIPLFAIAIAVLLAVDLRTVYESPLLLMGLNFLFSTLISIFVAGLMGSSFLTEGRPGLLFLGCGVLFWGAAGFVGAIFSTLRGGPSGLDPNTTVTIHNTCAWLSALCHIAGVTFSLRWKVSLRSPRLWLAGGYAATLGVVGFVTLATMSHWTPTFFVQGQGGTAVRQMVTGVTVAMFLLSAILLRDISGQCRTPFTRWYMLALILLAEGMSGVMFQQVIGGAVTWTARAAQFLGGVYMLAAALASIRGMGEYGVTLGERQLSPRYRYAIAIAVVISAAVFRMIFLSPLETRLAYTTFYPAVMFAALYGGFRSGLLATFVAGFLADYFWIEPTGELGITHPIDGLVILLFLATCALVSWLTEAMQRAEERAIRAEAEARYSLERQQAAELLRKSEARYHQVFGSTLVGTVIADGGGRIIEANQAFLRLVGRERSDLPFDIQTVTDPASHVRDAEASEELAITGTVAPYEKCFIRSDGTLVPVIAGAAPLEAGKGEVVMFALDMTDRKKAEDAVHRAHEELERRVHERTIELAATVQELHEKEHMLLQQSRLAAMGEMIHNIAHQWRQPLNTLGLHIQQLRLFYDMGHFSKDLLYKAVDDSMRLIHHMSGTIDDFRQFFKPDKEQVEFRVNEVIASALKLVEGAFNNRHITVSAQLSGDPVIRGYPNEYAQVVLNVLNNAREAVEARETRDPKVVIAAWSDGQRSVVTVTDNAGGIDEDIIHKVFDPHFTTKGPQGTGIGLFMAKSIIERSMHGKLSVRNVEDGAQFMIEV